DACPDAPTCANVTTPRGQASYKPQGRKPRHAPVLSGEAKALWGFDRSRAGAMAPAGQSIGGEHQADAGWRGSEAGVGGAAEAAADGSGRAKLSRPLSAVAAAKRTYCGCNRCSCCNL